MHIRLCWTVSLLRPFALLTEGTLTLFAERPFISFTEGPFASLTEGSLSLSAPLGAVSQRSGLSAVGGLSAQRSNSRRQFIQGIAESLSTFRCGLST